MFAGRGIVLFAMSLVVAAGLRHTESHGPYGLATIVEEEVEEYDPEDVVEAEEKAVEALESIAPPSGDEGDETFIPLTGSFQVAPTKDHIPVKTKFVLSVAHEPKPAEETLGIHFQFTAKHEAAATAFASHVQSLYNMTTAKSFDPPRVILNCSSKGRHVNLDIPGIDWMHRPVYDSRTRWQIADDHASTVEKIKGVVAGIGHFNVSVELTSDMTEIMAHLSNETVLSDKGFRVSIDAALTRAVQKMILSKLPSAPSQAGSPVVPADIIRKLFASADVSGVYNHSVIGNAPIVNMTYGKLVAMYRPVVAALGQRLRGSPFAQKVLDVINDLESIEKMDTIELSGLPDVKIMAVGNATAGAFEFLAKLAKDAGIEAALQNTVPSPPAPQYNETAIRN